MARLTRRLRFERLEDRLTPTSVVAPFLPDPAFGTSGKTFVTPDLGPFFANVQDAEVAADGKVWVLGSVGNNSVLARFTADGKLDATFEGDGLKPITPWRESMTGLSLSKLALRPDGGVLVGGQSAGGAAILPVPTADALTISPPYFPPNTEFVVVGLTADGSLDAAFGDGGRAVFDIEPANSFSNVANLQELALLADGRIALGGMVSAGFVYGASDALIPPPYLPQQKFTALRLTADGKLDPTYDADGIATVAARGGFNENFNAMTVSADGRVTVFGTRSDNSTKAFVTGYRLDAAGQPDAAFDADGYAEYLVAEAVTVPLPGVSATVYAGGGWAVPQPDGGIVFATTVSTSSYQYEPYFSMSRGDLTAVRIGAGGALDPAFGTDGFLRRLISSYDSRNIPPVTTNTLVVGVQAFADGTLGVLESTILYAPTTQYSTNLARYDANGRPLGDATRGNEFTFPVSPTVGESLQPRRVFFDTEGRLVAVGTSDSSTVTGTRLGVARLTPTEPPADMIEQTVFVAHGNGEVVAVQVDGTKPAVVGPPTKPFEGFTGTVVTRLADLDGDGVLDEVNAVGSTSALGSLVRATFRNADGTLQTVEVKAFEETFRGGVAVTTGDLDGDGKAEVVVSAARGGGGRVQIYSVSRDGFAKRADFFGIDDAKFRGGATTAIADLDADGRPELFVAAGQGGGPRVAAFAGKSLFSAAVGLAPPKLMNDFFAFGGADAARMRNGVSVAAADLNGDGRTDLIFGAGPGGARRVLGVDGPQLLAGTTTPLVNFFVADDATSRIGVKVAVRDINQDDRPDLVVQNGSELRFYDGTKLAVPNGQEPGVLRDVTAFPQDIAGIFVG